MELKILIKIIKKNLKLIIFCAILAGGMAVFVNHFKVKDYKVVSSINIIQLGKDQTDDYKYDNYYSQRAIEVFSDSFEKWFNDPTLIRRVIKESQLSRSIEKPSKFIKARKLAPNYLEISFDTLSPKEGQKIQENIAKIFKNKLQAQKKDKEIWFDLIFSDPYIEKNEISSVVLFLLTLIITAFATVFVVLIIHYLKET
ncbi:MAG: hypothetical protein GF335_04115 [Candidatus Moranbacteria bacterium]|nr:hypothetical protein [Candidatus Moranbacteria bacterium]